MVEGKISFGRFRLDLARRELRRDQTLVRLGSRARDILCVLASAEGKVVSKDELMERVWPGVIVEENNLQVHISALRRAFEGDGDSESWIVTVPGRGYRLLAAPEPPAADNTAAEPSASVPGQPSLAVLPFLNLSGDPEQEYFADGMVEEIITALARIRWLFVTARNSSFVYRGQNVDVKRVGRELGVRYMLEGSVRKSTNRVRITAQLIDAQNGAHIWADRFDGSLDDIFDLQDRVASGVIGAIEPKLRQSEIERASRKPTESLNAYDLYLRALAQFHEFTKEGCSEAIRLSRQAFDIDPSYAPAAALIGYSHHMQVLQRWAPSDPAGLAEISSLARRAVQSGKEDPDALWMAGFVMAFAGDSQDRRECGRPRPLTKPQFGARLDGSGLDLCLSEPTETGFRGTPARDAA